MAGLKAKWREESKEIWMKREEKRERVEKKRGFVTGERENDGTRMERGKGGGEWRGTVWREEKG